AVLLSLLWFGVSMQEPALPIPYIVLAVFALGRYAGERSGAVGAVVVGLLVALNLLLAPRALASWADAVFAVAVAAPPYLIGRVVRRLAEQSAELRRQQELVRAAAVREERGRLARDLHDVIAHSVSAMVVQASAAQELLRSDPDRAEQALGRVVDTGRRALGETARMLHLLRDEADELGLSPAPGLKDLDALVDGFRASGLRVDLAVEGDPSGLPPGVDVSAYRVVQEALTNARRYAADRVAELDIRCTDDAVRIRARNRSGGATGDGRFDLAVCLPVRPETTPETTRETRPETRMEAR
ncbi:MAG: sensor histidine kinase, partial [Actinomycetes bacterium]